MFGRKKGSRREGFRHADDCRIRAADPGVEIEWSELERGHWRAVCQCGAEDYYEPVADRVRSDPLDAKTCRHLPQCEYVRETDAAMLRVLLKVTDKGDYDWVQCGSCDAGWQVPHYASVG